MLLLTMQVVALSGGKDSVAMLLRMVELGSATTHLLAHSASHNA
jgi:tRNA(Ile)-lysidine synthase TilS/MesJ